MRNYLSEKFVIFSVGRCGSTALSSTFTQNGVRCVNEPFKLRNVNTTKKALEILNEYKPFHGIKTLCYQLNLNSSVQLKILSHFSKIIYLKRKVDLQAAISRAVGIQADYWHKEGHKPDEYPEIDLRIIRSHFYESLMCDRIVDKLYNVKTVYYEDLFIPPYYVIQDIFNFVGVEFNVTNKIRDILSPTQKISSFKTYRSIPNIKNIIKEFGDPFPSFL